MRKISTVLLMKLSLQGRFIIRFLTIILSAIAYALFSVSSIGFTTNLTDLNARGILHYYAPCLCIVYKHTDETGKRTTAIGNENLSLFEPILPAAYLYDGAYGATSLYAYTPNPETIPTILNFAYFCPFLGGFSTISAIFYPIF